MVGDLLIAGEAGGLYQLHWNGASFEAPQVGPQPPPNPGWEQITFAPLSFQPSVGACTASLALSRMTTCRPVKRPRFGGPRSADQERSASQTRRTQSPLHFFATPGFYDLRLSADDSQYVSSDDVQITVTMTPILTIVPIQEDRD